MRKDTRGVAAFLILTFAIAWFAWETAFWLGVPMRSGLFQLAVIPGAFAPAIAAFIVRKWVTREGFADAGLQPHFEKWPYYLAALLMPLGVVAVVALAAPPLGLGQPDVLLRDAPAGTAALPAGSRLLAIVVLSSVWAAFATPILWGEEFGWRGYLQLRLFPNQPLLAAIATGLIWGVWHFPLLARGSESPLHPLLSLAVFPLATVFYAIILGWLRLRSGSVWTSSFGHSAINNIGASLPPLLFAAQQDRFFISTLGLAPLAFFALLIVVSGGLNPPAAKTEGA